MADEVLCKNSDGDKLLDIWAIVKEMQGAKDQWPTLEMIRRRTSLLRMGKEGSLLCPPKIRLNLHSTSPVDNKPGYPDVSRETRHDCYRCPEDLEAPGVNILREIVLVLIMPIQFSAEVVL